MNGKLFEAELEFDKNVLTDEELTAYLEREFDEDEIIERNGHIVTIAFYIPKWEDESEYLDDVSIYIGDALKGYHYGKCNGYWEINIEELGLDEEKSDDE